MKSFIKLGSLFALIIAGRYMQSVAPIGAGMQQKPPMALFAPTTPVLTHYYVRYSSSTTAPVLPTSQGSQPKATATVWY